MLKKASTVVFNTKSKGVVPATAMIKDSPSTQCHSSEVWLCVNSGMGYCAEVCAILAACLIMQHRDRHCDKATHVVYISLDTAEYW